MQEQSRIEERKDMDKWVIKLALPFEERLNKDGNKIASGIYAFLPHRNDHWISLYNSSRFLTRFFKGEHHF